MSSFVLFDVGCVILWLGFVACVRRAGDSLLRVAVFVPLARPSPTAPVGAESAATPTQKGKVRARCLPYLPRLS